MTSLSMTVLGLPALDATVGALATLVVTVAFVAALLRPERF